MCCTANAKYRTADNTCCTTNDRYCTANATCCTADATGCTAGRRSCRARTYPPHGAPWTPPPLTSHRTPALPARAVRRSADVGFMDVDHRSPVRAVHGCIHTTSRERDSKRGRNTYTHYRVANPTLPRCTARGRAPNGITHNGGNQLRAQRGHALRAQSVWDMHPLPIHLRRAPLTLLLLPRRGNAFPSECVVCGCGTSTGLAPCSAVPHSLTW